MYKVYKDYKAYIVAAGGVDTPRRSIKIILEGIKRAAPSTRKTPPGSSLYFIHRREGSEESITALR